MRELPDTDHRSKSVNSNFAPSNNPRSLSFSAGITSSAMNDSVIYGARSGEPQALHELVELPVGVADFFASAGGHQSGNR